MSASENAKTLFFEALASMEASRFQEAEQLLHEALQLVPDNGAVLTNLSVALMQQGKRAEADEYAAKAAALDSKNVEALLVLAECRTQSGDFEEALAAYDRIVALDPAIAGIHNNRGIVLERLLRHADAVESYDRALALDLRFSDAHANRGNALQQLRRYEEAVAAYDQALALRPDLAEAWLGRGNALFETNPNDALAAYDKALALNPAMADAWLGRGNALCKLKRYDDALAGYDKALALHPGMADVLVGRGNALRDLNQDEALAQYDKALALVPDLAAAWIGRGNVFHDRKDYGEALAAYDRALAIDPKSAVAWLGRGNVLRLLKRVQESIESCRQALKHGGDAETTRYHLAALGAEPAPAAMPERFVASLFDGYANNFDKDLVENLKYQTPALLAEAIRRHAPPDALDILDLGCGTGLMGEHIHARARTLIGVDLSANMLEKARRRDVYDSLVCGDLSQFLQAQDRTFDLAIAADVFVYLGDLSMVFSGVRRVLRARGLFCFSVEAAADGDFVLQSTLRYAHSADYLRRLAAQNRFMIEAIESQMIRCDAGTNINGYLAVMRCV